jgi:hypothetical protein
MRKGEFFRRPVQSCAMYLPCNAALAAAGFGFHTDSIAACQFAHRKSGGNPGTPQ